MVSSQSSMAAATLGAVDGLGYTYTWACDNSLTYFNPGSVPYIGSNFTATQESGTEGGWKFIRAEGGTGVGIVGVFPSSNLTTGGGGGYTTLDENNQLPAGTASPTNKYLTYVITFLEGYDYADFHWYYFRDAYSPFGSGAARTLGVSAASGPPEYINGVQISEKVGTSMTLLSEYSTTRNATTGLLNDNSEKGKKLSLSFNLTYNDTLIGTETFDWISFYTTNNMENYNMGFIWHGIILGPDPVPDLTGKSIEVNNPIPV